MAASSQLPQRKQWQFMDYILHMRSKTALLHSIMAASNVCSKMRAATVRPILNR